MDERTKMAPKSKTNLPTGRKIAAMLIDFENVAIPLDITVGTVTNVTSGIIQWLKTVGHCEIGESHAFADWRDYPRSRDALTGLGITCHQVDKNPGKNGADIALAMEAQRIFSERPEITRLFIMSGDADFCPLLRSAQRYGREVMLASCPKELSLFLLDAQGTGKTFIITPDGCVFPFHDFEMMVLRAAVKEFIAVRAQYPSVRADLFMQTPLVGEFEDINQVKRKVTIESPHGFVLILDSLTRQGYINKWEQNGEFSNWEVFAPNPENELARQLLKELEEKTTDG